MMHAMAEETEPCSVARAPERIGRYHVFPAFAHGGMASVHLGRLDGPSGFSRVVAVKRLNAMFATSERHARMLVEEARVTARIRSPYVVPVLEMVHEGERLCIVMELVVGVSLATLLATAADRGERVAPPIAVSIMADVLRGLHAAHEATSADGKPLEIIHRDVSPQNILLGADGIARVLDFGIARALGREPLSRTGEVHGKLAYIAPEQLRAGPITRRADIYAAGAVLWEALAGARLRQGDSPMALAAGALEPALAPSSRQPSLPRELDSIVLQALALDEHRRWATAEAMAFALEEACPPASRDDVARFVERVAGGDLERLAEAVTFAERYSLSASATGTSADLPHPHHRQPRRVAAIALVSAVSVATAAAFVHRGRAALPVTPTSSAVVAPANAPPPPVASVASTAAPDGIGAMPSSSAVVRAPGRSARPNAKVIPPSPSPSRAPPSCTPPYDVDERGIKRYKPGCIP
jgi:eukaryotic-like serine/threonine-protein kinase